MMAQRSPENEGPLTWIGNFPVYVSTALAGVHGLTLILTAVAMAAGAEEFLQSVAFSSQAFTTDWSLWQAGSYAFVHRPSYWLLLVELYLLVAFGKEIEGAEKIIDTLYFGGDYEMLFELIKADPKRINEVRFFIGYAGWDFEQLNNEMKDHSWIAVTNISEKEILSTSSDHFWKDCMTKQGSKFEMISNFPLNPNEN